MRAMAASSCGQAGPSVKTNTQHDAWATDGCCFFRPSSVKQGGKGMEKRPQEGDQGWQAATRWLPHHLALDGGIIRLLQRLLA
jgi:hypothetical protein